MFVFDHLTYPQLFNCYSKSPEPEYFKQTSGPAVPVQVQTHIPLTLKYISGFMPKNLIAANSIN